MAGNSLSEIGFKQAPSREEWQETSSSVHDSLKLWFRGAVLVGKEGTRKEKEGDLSCQVFGKDNSKDKWVSESFEALEEIPFHVSIVLMNGFDL